MTDPTVRVSEEARDRVQEYCQAKGLFIRHFASKALLEAVEKGWRTKAPEAKPEAKANPFEAPPFWEGRK